MKPKLIQQHGGPLSVFRLPEDTRTYVMGVDPAGGKSTDDWSAIVVIDMQTAEDVCTWRGHIEPHDLAEVCMCLGTFYGGSKDLAFCTPESNNHGIALVDSLRQVGYWNLYARKVWDKIVCGTVSTIGFMTSMKTRPVLINRGRMAVSDMEIRVNNPVILKEMSTYIRDENGREDHQPGCHDDTLFAWMLALEGRHVAYFDAQPEAAPDAQPVVDAEEERRSNSQWVWEELDKKVSEAEELRYVRDTSADTMFGGF